MTTSSLAASAAWIAGSSSMRSGRNFTPGSAAGEDRERVEAHVDGAEQRRLDQLQIALIAGRQLRDDAQHFVQRCAGGRRAAADQLENVRVALLRHDRRAGRERVRQLDERKLLRVEQQQVGGQTAGVLHHERDLEHQLRFGLAARELHGRHGLLHLREAERRTRPLAIERHVRRRHNPRRSRADSCRGDAGTDASLPHRRATRPRNRRPTMPPSWASPAACGCSRGAATSPWRAPARRARQRPQSTPASSSSTASFRYRRSAVSTWSLRERPRCTRLPASPMRSTSRFSSAVCPSSCSSCTLPLAARVRRGRSRSGRARWLQNRRPRSGPADGASPRARSMRARRRPTRRLSSA